MLGLLRTLGEQIGVKKDMSGLLKTEKMFVVLWNKHLILLCDQIDFLLSFIIFKSNIFYNIIIKVYFNK